MRGSALRFLQTRSGVLCRCARRRTRAGLSNLGIRLNWQTRFGVCSGGGDCDLIIRLIARLQVHLHHATGILYYISRVLISIP